jgi:hypothetical protein
MPEFGKNDEDNSAQSSNFQPIGVSEKCKSK